jgi:hypothetical protein
MDGEHSSRPSIRGLFRGQGERAFVFGKLERLAHATVLILSQTSSEHPVVERLQTSVLDTIREAAAGASELEQSFLVSIVLETVSLIRIAATAGIISESNANILVGEYMLVLSKLSQPSVQGILLRTEDLLSEEELSARSDTALPSPIGSLFSPEAASLQHPSTDSKSHKGQRTPSVSRPPTKKDTEASRASDRSQRIIDIVTVKGVVSIRDVALVITDCSEKTLQRELLALVERGVLAKKGERRWSTYRLA